MTVFTQDVLAEAGAGGVDSDTADRVLAEATIHVTEFIAATLLDGAKPVPDVMVDAATLRCAVDLFFSAKTPMGAQVLGDGSGQPVINRIATDPLARVRPLLARWCGADLGIA